MHLLSRGRQSLFKILWRTWLDVSPGVMDTDLLLSHCNLLRDQQTMRETKVCPMMEDRCPDMMMALCPDMMMPMPMPLTRSAKNRMSHEGEGCQCVPDFLLAMVPGMPAPGTPVAGRSATNRAGVTG